MNTNKLSDYGYSFQIKVLASLLKNKVFLNQISDILDKDYFESDAAGWILTTIIDYFHIYKNPPTMEVIKVKLIELDNDVLKQLIIDYLKEVWKSFDSDDLQFVEETALAFCKNQKLKNAIIDSVALLKLGEYDEIKVKIDEALKAGSDRNIGHEYFEDVDIRYSDSVRNVVATGWDVIDDLMDGGLGKGELGVFVAPAGIGKSWGLVNIGAAAVKKGLTVIHYTLELNQSYVGLRYDSVYTGISSQDLKYNIDDVKLKISELKGNLIIKHYPTKSAMISTLSSHMDKCILQGIKPDLIIVDYADLLKSNKSARELRHEIGSIYEMLRGLAGEYEIPIWTASQANRSSLEDDVIGADKISEDYSKIMTADFVASLSRKLEDKLAGTGRVHVIKNRFGPDGITLPTKMNTSSGRIDIFDGQSASGKATQNEMNGSEEYTRKLLQQKFKSLTGN